MQPDERLRVFVAAAWTSAERVRALHEQLRTLAGARIESVWADENTGSAENLDECSDEAVEKAWKANRGGIVRSHVVVVLADTPTREGHAEAEYARMLNKAILWVGAPTLTARMFKYKRMADDASLIAYFLHRKEELRDYISRGCLDLRAF